MKSGANFKRYLRPAILGAMIPAVILAAAIFGWPKTLIIPIIMLAGLITATMTLWIYANSQNDSSDWWHDDSASGWRGY